MSDNSLSRELTQKIKLINRIISITLASSKIKTIKINQEGGEYNDLYPPMSLYFFAKYGSLKSTMLSEVSKITKQRVLKKVTSAGLVGSISEKGSGLVSPVWSHRKSTMAIDEFNAKGESARDTKQAILDIIEKGEYSKAIGRPVSKPVKLKDGNLYFEIEEGTISFKTHCGAIFCTMLKHQADDFHMALLSRCIPIHYEITDPRLILNGLVKFSFKEIKVKENVVISKKDWAVIIDATMKYTVDDHTRTASMLARVFAVLGKHDDNLYQIICGLRNDLGLTSEAY